MTPLPPASCLAWHLGYKWALGVRDITVTLALLKPLSATLTPCVNPC